MAELWDAEWVVDAELARELIDAQFPSLTPARVVSFSSGWDNAAFLVNDEWVFRFPRRAVADALAVREAALLPLLAPTLPLPIPVPEHVGRPTERFPHPFAGYRRLTGTTSCRVRLSDDQHAATAEALGRFLAAVHAFPVERAVSVGVGPDQLGRLELPMRREKTRRQLMELLSFGLVSPAQVDALASILEATPPVEPIAHVLLHGDLYSRHLLVGERHGLCGVIDWGDVHVGHPASDLEVAHSFLPARSHDAFRHAYGHIDDLTWELARFRAIGHVTMALRFGHLIDDATLRHECQWALAHIADRR